MCSHVNCGGLTHIRYEYYECPDVIESRHDGSNQPTFGLHDGLWGLDRADGAVRQHHIGRGVKAQELGTGAYL